MPIDEITMDDFLRIKAIFEIETGENLNKNACFNTQFVSFQVIVKK